MKRLVDLIAAQTKGTIAGKNETYNWDNRVGPFVVHFWDPNPPKPP